MRRLTLAEIYEARAIPGHAALLYLTDRCPVGCAHCSVDALQGSPTIEDRAKFRHLVDELADIASLVTVGISGGEPFVERSALGYAAERLAAAGKLVVPYTSGVWARGGIPKWTTAVLSNSSSVVLSTDIFHLPGVDHTTVVAAARAIVAAGPWLIVQVVDIEDSVDRAVEALDEACGAHWQDIAELSVVPPMHIGRGTSSVEAPTRRRAAADFGTCWSAATPVLRYDGRATACCNEDLISGHGPERLNRDVVAGGGVAAAFDAFRNDSVLEAIRRIGLGPLTRLPRYADVGSERFRSICDVCWAVNRAAGDDVDQAAQALVAIAARPAPTEVHS